MELVYLWVENYKNIHKQGFNFSPRFECDYDGKELTIKENDDHIKDFFGENINVTAIVGKNGSGKSSVLNNIYLLTLDGYSQKLKYIICFQNSENNKILINTNIENILNKDDINKLDYIQHSEYRNSSTHKYIKLIKKYKLYKNKNITLNSISFMFIPQKIKIKPNDNLDSNILSYIDMEYYDKIDEEEYCVANGWNSNSELEEDKEKNFFKKSLEGLDDLKKIILNKEIDNKIQIWELKAFLKGLKNNFLKKIEIEYTKLKNIELDKFIEINEEVINYVENIKDFIQIDFKDRNDATFSELSSGEQQYSILFLESYESIINNKSNNIVYGIDEAETFLHPDWQKRIIKDLIKIFHKMNKSIHFILTSHSPFLLSDIPKQNIIFLDKDEKGNCKVVDGLKEKKQTFGANIHTLLSDSFFMEDGLMGEFAKSKIDKAIKLLNQDKLDEKELKYCEQIISIIGEPIVKNQLQRMLDSKRLKKVDKIDAIEKDIKLLQEELAKLKK